MQDLPSLTIDATALYALAAPTVPHDVRQEAIAIAESGERITKAKAEEMVSIGFRLSIPRAGRR